MPFALGIFVFRRCQFHDCSNCKQGGFKSAYQEKNSQGSYQCVLFQESLMFGTSLMRVFHHSR